MASADPLQLLREYTVANKPIKESGSALQFGEYLVDKKVETNWKATSSGYYTLEALWFVWKTSSLAHANYVVQAKQKDTQIVTLVDKKGIISYLKGETDTNPSIDVTKIVITTLSKKRPADGDRADAAKRNRHDDARRQAREATSQEASSTAVSVKPLGEKLTSDKVAELKARVAANRQKDIRAPTQKDGQAVSVGALSGPIKAILERERPLRTRDSILRSRGKSFEGVIKVWEQVRQKEEATKKAQERAKQPAYNRYDAPGDNVWKEHGAATDEFDIDTTGGYLSRPNPTTSTAKPATTKAPPIHRVPSRPEKPRPDDGIPIILVPNATTSLVSIYNIKQLLQDFQFITTDEVQKEQPQKPRKVTLTRPNANSENVVFYVYDDTTRFTEHEWNRVVACFTHGAMWQFKGWPWGGEPSSIFNHVLGVHVMYDDKLAKITENIQKWQVKLLKVNRSKRYLDKTAALFFWQELDMFWSKRSTHTKIK
eukprot:comp23920_c4_seq1/m.42210 comp23920_c4_seq1/g.42210  ORF comp23920_c4_seq1/g.42210 comp23920_c4_seq1/m.42210 type:complete len:485 (-) comp23920_c4_seq1:324-1778(-)